MYYRHFYLQLIIFIYNVFSQSTGYEVDVKSKQLTDFDFADDIFLLEDDILLIKAAIR